MFPADLGFAGEADHWPIDLINILIGSSCSR